MSVVVVPACPAWKDEEAGTSTFSRLPWCYPRRATLAEGQVE